MDHSELLVQLHHVDDEEDGGEDHLADGHGGVSPGVRRRIADDDDETEELEEKGGAEKTCQGCFRFLLDFAGQVLIT